MRRLRGETDRGGAAPGLAAWRSACLHRRGLSEPLAERLAGDSRYDLHALLELLDRGCPAELAVRILAPIDDGGLAG
jgi:hypothetical protein